MTEIISSLLSPPSTTITSGQLNSSFIYEEFGLSLYPAEEPLSFPYMGVDKGEEKGSYDNTNNFLDSSLFFTEGNWCSSFTDFGLFPNSFENEFLSDTPASTSFPPTPISCSGSDPLSPEDQQEINDIVSSFQNPSSITPQPPDTSLISPVSPSVPFLPPSPSLPPPTPTLGKRSCVSSRSSSKRTATKAVSTSRKDRKKEQNKSAAFRYRQKKRSELDALLKQEEELEITNKQLKDQVESLTTEISYLKNLWSEVCKAKATK